MPLKYPDQEAIRAIPQELWDRWATGDATLNPLDFFTPNEILDLMTAPDLSGVELEVAQRHLVFKWCWKAAHGRAQSHRRGF